MVITFLLFVLLSFASGLLCGIAVERDRRPREDTVVEVSGLPIAIAIPTYKRRRTSVSELGADQETWVQIA